MKKITLILAVLLLSACTSENDFNKGKQQLENQGYHDIKNTGYDWFCCDEKDSYSTGFECKDKAGNTVRGCICSGMMKGITIRFQ